MVHKRVRTRAPQIRGTRFTLPQWLMCCAAVAAAAAAAASRRVSFVVNLDILQLIVWTMRGDYYSAIQMCLLSFFFKPM